MMETKLWVALCALLLANLGSADHGGNEATPESPAAESKPTSSLNPIVRAVTPPSPNVTNTSAEVTSSLGSNATTVAPEPKKENVTSVVSPSEATSPEKIQTHQSTAQPPIASASESHAPTSHIPLSSTTISSTPPTNISHNATFPPPDSNSTSNKATHNQTFTPGSTPEPPKPDNTTHNTSVQSSTTSNSSSSQEPHSTESHTLTALQTTVQPDRHSETSTAAHQKSTTSSLPGSTTQAKAHTETPSQLNVGGDTMMNHEAPTLDPLLAGLVSAFIVTAVIIALLLFLKLRRRDNRPEFRRLQELPMDDMMEDTPLSMYSY